MRLNAKATVIALLGLTVLFISACAGIKPVEPADAELQKRVRTYWALRASHDFAESYPYETPEFRGETSLTGYVTGLGGGIVHTAEVASISKEADRAEVYVALTYSLASAGLPTRTEMKRTIPDFWQRIDGQWYHHLTPPPESKAVHASPKLPEGQTDKRSWRLSTQPLGDKTATP